MNITLSRKAQNISPSVTLDITAKAKEMKSRGIDVISFGAGEPDFNTPKNIQSEAIRAIENGNTRYTATSGIQELKEAICNKLKNDNKLQYNPSNIIVSSGAKHSLFNALSAILNPGDEVIIPVPYWVSYPELVKLADGVPRYVNTLESNGFKYTIDELNKTLSSKTKAIMLNSPNNPTGSVYTIEELQSIAKWALENNIMIISDEIYEKLVYDNVKHISIASISEEIKDITIVINGMSKAYAMTGWRIGYAAANEKIIKLMTNIQAHTTSNPASISQYASVQGLNGDQSIIIDMKKQFEHRRNFMVDRVNSINGISCRKPLGAFYVMVNISNIIGRSFNGTLIRSSIDLSNYLLEYGKVAVIPGTAFGDDSYIRLSYATSMENIEEGLRRIENSLV